ncbi:putative membrane protein [Streptomyces scabiei 87.22]|uniref:Putative membrane protein n=1 Tax=Streptomyces scabiei (strain 87.22) TaxID=680198 RepID=C9ZFJ1_STRSW|nr:putative membrane protein [Streptomyces scabiei 87.22]
MDLHGEIVARPTDTAVGRPERRPPVVLHVSCAVVCAVTTLVIIPSAGGRLYTC